MYLSWIQGQREGDREREKRRCVPPLVPPTALTRAPHLSLLSLSLPLPPIPSTATTTTISSLVGDHLLLLNPDPVRPPPFHLRKTLLGFSHTPFFVSCRVVVRSLEIASSTSNHHCEYPQPPPYPPGPTPISPLSLYEDSLRNLQLEKREPLSAVSYLYLASRQKHQGKKNCEYSLFGHPSGEQQHQETSAMVFDRCLLPLAQLVASFL
ncbi:hypothetical protein BDP55DRAFT_258895 [Colletotrichum godetiae]|uniref:Uncharacterized protein n=1 Tax=Colletotrichum godetiae TaxID=1209918 RepID=A0AAJ0AYA5_9PEZI|nr:uncharacterized protein BDP55DRAFT_258895 [Colletotrichum godetiae]KAK1691246.1 hypothetical protein BDP55DRAFT_258895 [Colletotrichum godetiae]